MRKAQWRLRGVCFATYRELGHQQPQRRSQRLSYAGGSTKNADGYDLADY